MTPLFERLGAVTGIGLADLQRIVVTAPRRYKVFNIAKRGGGEREIAQPAREVKRAQRALVEVLLSRLPVHDVATAYRRGGSILENAKPHANSGPILKLDFKNFFPSLRDSDWRRYCRRTGCLESEQDIQWTTTLLFRHDSSHHGLRLAIGAPSSPILSNILMYQFDEIVSGLVTFEHVVYTRYADDMTFSAPKTGYLNHVRDTVVKVIRDLESPRLWLNDDKTTYVTKKYRRQVTGLTLANDGRVTIGRERKRLMRAMMHRAVLGELGKDDLRILAGILAYINSVEPEFLIVLSNKYGEEAVKDVQRQVRKGNKLDAHEAPFAIQSDRPGQAGPRHEG